jgi:hypothetical protein
MSFFTRDMILRSSHTVQPWRRSKRERERERERKRERKRERERVES